MNRQIGAIPYRIREDQIELVLITTRRGKHWIFPKGQIEKRMSFSEVAAMEAFEEAGVRGRIDKSNVREVTVRRGHGKVRLKVYPMKCDKVLEKWPESRERERVVIRFEDALQLIKRKSLRKCVKRMMREVA